MTERGSSAPGDNGGGGDNAELNDGRDKCGVDLSLSLNTTELKK